jgi:hypothetical protein
MPNKVDYGVVDLSSPFLLDPMTTSLQNYRLTQFGNEVRHIGYAFAETGKIQHDIAFAGHVQRWYGDLCTGKRSEQLPVAIDVAVPVKTPAKPRPREFCGIEVHIRFGEPRRQGYRIQQLTEDPLSRCTIPTALRSTTLPARRGASPEIE